MQRRVAVLVGLTLAGLSICWSAVWLFIAHDIDARLGTWVAQRRAEGMAASYRDLAVGGFPFSWKVVIDEPSLSGAGATHWHWSGASVTARIRPWIRHDVAMSFPGEHRLGVGEGTAAQMHAIVARQPTGRLLLEPDGRLAELSLDLGDVTLRRLPDGSVTTVQQAKATLRPHRVAEPTHSTDTFDATVGLHEITLPAAPPNGFGPRIARAEADLNFKGALPAGRLAEAVAVWRDDGGTIEINRVAVVWGPLDVDGSGTLALDDELRPMGAFTTRLRGYGAAIDTLVGAGQIQPRQAAAIKIALNLLARSAQPGTPSQVTVPVTAQDGRLFVSGFPFLRLAPLRLE
ncbi:MAG: DUF2125 domain-containing protein [Proteobacteria bacterium]|nr:DUF2125 domain-containing protein [Pseudomonadota bacterium]